MRADDLRLQLEAAVDRLNRYPTRCYECVNLGPAHSASCEAELSLFRTEVKGAGFSVHIAAGNIGVVSRRLPDDDARLWSKIIHRLMCGADRRTSVEVEIRESLAAAFESLMGAFSEWISCSLPQKRTLAPKYDVTAFTVTVKKHMIERNIEKYSSARIADISSSLAEDMMQALSIVDSASAASASIHHPNMTVETRCAVKHDVSNALAYAMIERGIVGKVNPNGTTIVFRPSFEHVVRKIMDLLVSSSRVEDQASVQFRDPIYAFVGREVGIEAYRKTIVGSSPISSRCSYIGIHAVTDYDGCPYDSVAFVPRNCTPEELASIARRFPIPVYSISSLLSDNHPLALSQVPTRLSMQHVESVESAIRKLQSDVGLAFCGTGIPYDATVAAQVKTYLAESEQNIYEVHLGDRCVELLVHEPALWQRLANELELFCNGQGKRKCVQTLMKEKSHNDLRSKIMQKVKNFNLFVSQECVTLQSGRVVNRMTVGPSSKAHYQQSASKPPIPSQNFALPAPHSLERRDENPSRPSAYLSGQTMAVVQPPYRNAPGRALNMSAHALYQLIAPNQEQLPSGWEYRVLSSGLASQCGNDRGVVMINHMTRKGYSGIQTPEDVHCALLADGGEVAYASALLNGESVPPFTNRNALF
jgi:hypothetical protein